MSLFLCFLQEFVQGVDGTNFYMYRRASAYFLIVVLEYIFDMFRLDEHVHSIVIVRDDFTGITFVYHALEFGVS